MAGEIDEKWWRDNYNTQLSPEEEERYNAFAEYFNDVLIKRGARKPGWDVRNDDWDYDVRGAYKEGLLQKALRDPRAHGSDRYKKPNHPTFSDQSVYHGAESPWGWAFEGGAWGEGNYTPSKAMLAKTHSRERMADYFRRYEPGVKLILPE